MESTQPKLIAFDVDGTLIDHDNKPRYEVIDLFRALQALGCDMIIWSGGGVDYATHWRDKLGLKATVVPKGSIQPDLAVDDFLVNLGKVNFQVPGDGSKHE